MSSDAGDVTVLLRALESGDAGAAEKLYPLIYVELRRLAGSYMRRERLDHTLQPTALIHEAYIRLTNDPGVHWQNRSHFVGLAATVMRRILVDHARSHNAAIHGGGVRKVPLDEAILVAQTRSDEVLAIDKALERLAKESPRQAKVVELRFFAGLSVEETAAVLGIAPRTVKGDWALARIWLYKQMGTGSEGRKT